MCWLCYENMRYLRYSWVKWRSEFAWICARKLHEFYPEFCTRLYWEFVLVLSRVCTSLVGNLYKFGWGICTGFVTNLYLFFREFVQVLCRVCTSLVGEFAQGLSRICTSSFGNLYKFCPEFVLVLSGICISLSCSYPSVTCNMY